MNVRNLNEINIYEEPYGIYNKTLTKDGEDGKSARMIESCMAKINFSGQIINNELTKKPDASVLICVLVCACWIQESVNIIKNSFQNNILNELDNELSDFYFDKSIIKRNDKFLKAVRSFVFAHPYDTCQHKDFGFDGTLKCCDILSAKRFHQHFFGEKLKDRCSYMDIGGIIPYSTQGVSYWLAVYDENKDDGKNGEGIYNCFIGVSLGLICNVVNNYIDYLYKMDECLCQYKGDRDENEEKGI